MRLVFLQRLDDAAAAVERQQRLHVDDLDLDPDLGQQLGRFQRDPAAARRR